MTTTTKRKQTPKFELGQIVATPGALEALAPAQIRLYLARHLAGDWGCIDPEDAAQNDLAVHEGCRLHSAYPIDPAKPCLGYGDNCVWIITEWDRSVTTLLLPDEY